MFNLKEEKTDENDVYHEKKSTPNNELISMNPVKSEDLKNTNPFLQSVGDRLEHER